MSSLAPRSDLDARDKRTLASVELFLLPHAPCSDSCRLQAGLRASERGGADEIGQMSDEERPSVHALRARRGGLQRGVSEREDRDQLAGSTDALNGPHDVILTDPRAIMGRLDGDRYDDAAET